MGVSGGSRRLLRKTGLARESQQAAILRLYNSHAKKQARPPPPAVDEKTGQPLFHPVVNHRPPPVPPRAGIGIGGGGGGGGSVVVGDNVGGGVVTPRSVATTHSDVGDMAAGSVCTPRVTPMSKQRAALKLYDNAMAKLGRQHDIVQIQEAMYVGWGVGVRGCACTWQRASRPRRECVAGCCNVNVDPLCGTHATGTVRFGTPRKSTARHTISFAASWPRKCVPWSPRLRWRLGQRWMPCVEDLVVSSRGMVVPRMDGGQVDGGRRGT